MTGFRIGVAAGPEWLIKAMEKLQSHSSGNPCSISQAAAIAAFDPEGASGVPRQVFTEMLAKIYKRKV